MKNNPRAFINLTPKDMIDVLVFYDVKHYNTPLFREKDYKDHGNIVDNRRRIICLNSGMSRQGLGEAVLRAFFFARNEMDGRFLGLSAADIGRLVERGTKSSIAAFKAPRSEKEKNSSGRLKKYGRTADNGLLTFDETVNIICLYDIEHCRFPHNFIKDEIVAVEMHGLALDEQKLILIDKDQGVECMRISIIHEITHVRHYLLGDLEDDKNLERRIIDESNLIYKILYGSNPNPK